jgi:hypothetical protein
MSIRFEVFTAVILDIQVIWNVTPGQWAISSQHFEEFNVCKSVHHHMIQINQPTRHNSFTSLLLDVYVSFNMFWALPRPSSEAYNCISSLWFCRWSVGGSSVVGCGLAGYNRPDHDQQCCYRHAPMAKPEAVNAW